MTTPDTATRSEGDEPEMPDRDARPEPLDEQGSDALLSHDAHAFIAVLRADELDKLELDQSLRDE